MIKLINKQNKNILETEIELSMTVEDLLYITSLIGTMSTDEVNYKLLDVSSKKYIEYNKFVNMINKGNKVDNDFLMKKYNSMTEALLEVIK